MDLVCLAGQYLNETLKACFSCPGGTYNSVPGLNVWCESCIMNCSRFSHLVYVCNETHNNFCECDDGYFRYQSNSQPCSKIKKHLLAAVNNFTGNNFTGNNFTGNNFTGNNFTGNNSAASNFSTGDQAFNSTPTNTPATSDLICHWFPWLPAWSCISPAWAVIIGIMCFLFVGLVGLFLYIFYKRKSQAKRQQLNAAMMPDREKDLLVEQQQEVQEEKHKLLWDQENQNSIVNDARNSLSQFNSGGSCQAGIPESCLDVDCPDSARSTVHDHAGWTPLRIEALPPSSLCQELECRYSSLDLREDDLTPIKEVAEVTGRNA